MKYLTLSDFHSLVELEFSRKKIGNISIKNFQKRCFRELYKNESLLLCTETGSGKTLVAKFLITKTLSERKIACYLVPTIELLKEKARDLQQFFGDLAKVVIISGEIKPNISEIRRNEKKLIIIAVYEAFLSFLFRIRKFEYFHKMCPFGCVIIDESHFIGDIRRGTALEMVIRMLRTDMGLQLLLMSASFTEESGIYWSKVFGLKLIYEKGKRRFFVKIRGYTNNNNKEEVLLGSIDEFIMRYVDKDKEKSLALIFCRSRRDTEYYSRKIRDYVMANYEMEQDITFYCGYLHAGLNLSNRECMMQEFKNSTIGILCCTSALEVGVDIPDVETIIILRPHLYDGRSLEQFSGRCRSEDGVVVHILPEAQKDGFMIRLMGYDEDSETFEGYLIEEIMSNLYQKIWAVVIQRLYKHNYTLKELYRHIEEFLGAEENVRLGRENGFSEASGSETFRAKFLEEYMKEIIKRGVKLGYIKELRSRYRLNRAGEAMVESLLPRRMAEYIYKYFDKNPRPKGVQLRELHIKLVRMYYQSIEKIKKDQLKNILDFIKIYDSTDKEFWKKHPKIEFQIEEGIAEVYRRTALWIAHSMYSILRGWWADKAEKEGFKYRKGYFYVVDDFGKIKSIELNVINYLRRMKRLIRRFSTENYKYYSVPMLRKQRKYYKGSRYKKQILKYIREAGSGGITSKEIKRRMENDRLGIIKKLKELEELEDKKAKSRLKKEEEIKIAELQSYKNKIKLEFPVESQIKKSSVQSQLTNLTRSGVIVAIPQVQNRSGRPAYIYKMPEFVDEEVITNKCKECKYLKLRRTERGLKTYCYKKKMEMNRRNNACGEFEKKERTQAVFSIFKHGKEGIICPLCNKMGTLGVPRKDEVAVCDSCNCLVRRIKGGKFMAIKRGLHEPGTLYIRDGHRFSYFPTGKMAITVFKNEILSASRAGKKGVYIFTVSRKNKNRTKIDEKKSTRSYFSDDIYLVYLKGGKISQEARKILKKLKIRVEKSEKPENIEDRKYDMVHELLRDGLKKIKEDPDKKENIIDFAISQVVAKIMSNLIYTKYSIKNYQDDLKYKRQKDILMKIIMERSINTDFSIKRLRTWEGRGEWYAWETERARLMIRNESIRRVRWRFINTWIIYGSKAYDPFNAAMNYIYGQLSRISRRILSEVGFDREKPGVGIMHSVVGRVTNQEIVYDFIDQFRPVFRHKLVSYVKDGTLNISDFSNRVEKNGKIVHFYRKLDEWYRYIYYVNGYGKKVLDRLVEEALETEFLYLNKKLELRYIKMREIIKEEATSLANFILRNIGRGELVEDLREDTYNLGCLPFVTFKTYEDREEIVHELSLINHFYGKGPPIKVNAKWAELMYKEAGDPIDKIISLVEGPVEIELPDKHVIIIAHKDADGFYSALQIYKKYYKEKGTKITVVPTMPARLVYVLNNLSKKYYEKEVIVYILDIAINKWEYDLLKEIFKRYLQSKRKIKIIWIDHHELEFSKNKLEKDWGIKVINESRKELTCGMLVYNYINRLELGRIHYRFVDKLGCEMSCDLNYWSIIFTSGAFKAKYPTKFFERVLNDKKNRVYDRYYNRARALGLKYSRIDIYKTKDGLNFVVVKLENNPPTGQILRFLKEYGPEDVVLEFAVVIRPSLNYSLYNIGGRELQFKVLEDDLVSYGLHESEALAVPATGLVIKRAGALTYRRVLLIDEFITILEEKEIGLGFNEISGMRSKSMSNLKRFMRDLSEIIEFYMTFGVEDTKQVRDGKIYERYVEVYKYYRAFRKEVLEDQILSWDLFMDLVFKKGITIDMIKIWTEQMEIKELKRAVYEIK
ncbi:MAG: DEAD/DEAH box helicase, partial [Candidatus Helarchaeota archaeon]